MQNSSMKIQGILLILVLVAIVGGLTLVFSSSDSASEESATQADASSPSQDASDAPAHLRSAFPDTDFSKTSINYSEVLSGGPGKDGIPAIDEPKFIPISESDISGNIQAIVYVGESEVRAYPYNILDWHEIVNDTVEGTDISVTFCPLCGSAIVYDRSTSQGSTTFGVSGSLRESNMIMYDRSSETLWQQSTGEAIVGELLGEQLKLLPFQLLTLDEVRTNYPDAKVLSTDTGYNRDYDRSPYGDYGDNDRFIFAPSTTNDDYFVKEIFIVVNSGERSVAIPNMSIKDGDTFTDTETNLTISKANGEITITDASGATLPFYFEMWFSWAVQHEDDPTARVFDPAKI